MLINDLKNNITLKDGYQEIIIDAKSNVDLIIETEKCANVFVKIINVKDLNINYTGHQNSDVTMLFWNETSTDVNFNEHYEILNDAKLKVAYGDLNSGSLIRNSIVNLNGKNSNALLKSATLTKSKKHYYVKVVSNVPYSYGDIENYSVVLENGDYKMEATGKIEKGAYKSSSHQTSRALCLHDNQTSFIQPNLMIDENDVLASHATSVGRVDENQMVYMQSRGLRVNEIMALISFGYLLPIADMIENKEMKEKLKASIESQVSKECL